jgi:hypothetical protein
MDINVLVTLLTITVILLSIIIIAWLAALTVVLIKVRQVLKNVKVPTKHGLRQTA